MDPSVRAQLPVALDVQRYGSELGGMLSQVADGLRANHADDPTWLLRKRARDQVNQIKTAKTDIGGPLSGFIERAVDNDADDAFIQEVAEVLPEPKS